MSLERLGMATGNDEKLEFIFMHNDVLVPPVNWFSILETALIFFWPILATF